MLAAGILVRNLRKTRGSWPPKDAAETLYGSFTRASYNGGEDRS
jgi:hypothetical protein